MESRDLWSELPLEVKVMIFELILAAKKLISLKIVCKDWNFVISNFCAPNLSPPNPCAPLWGILSVEEEYSDKGRNSCFRRIRKDGFGPLRRFGPNINLIRRSILSLTPSEEREADYKEREAELFRPPNNVALEPGTGIAQFVTNCIRLHTGNVLDCCNGMILFASISNRQYYVGNPLTRQRFDVQVSPNTQTTTHSSLIFDPSLLLCDEKDPVFKIVSFVRPAQQATVSHPMQVDIYSSDQAEWCSYVLELEHLYGFEWLPNSVYFNRTLYSLSVAMYLVCMDVIPVTDSEPQGLRARAIALPDRDEVSYCGCIGNCSGSFYYSNRDLQGSSILVWMLENSEWALMHRISISEDIGHYTGVYDPSAEFIKNIIDKEVESLKQHDHFRPRLIFLDDDNEMTIFIGPKGFLSYKVKTKSTEFQIWPLSTDSWKLEATGDRFFPFSPCPLVLKSPGTCNLVPYSACRGDPSWTCDSINGVKLCGISCVVGFIFCVASFFLK